MSIVALSKEANMKDLRQARKAAAQRAKDAGSTRFCMGAAWRELGNKKGAGAPFHPNNLLVPNRTACANASDLLMHEANLNDDVV